MTVVNKSITGYEPLDALKKGALIYPALKKMYNMCYPEETREKDKTENIRKYYVKHSLIIALMIFTAILPIINIITTISFMMIVTYYEHRKKQNLSRNITSEEEGEEIAEEMDGEETELPPRNTTENKRQSNPTRATHHNNYNDGIRVSATGDQEGAKENGEQTNPEITKIHTEPADRPDTRNNRTPTRNYPKNPVIDTDYYNKDTVLIGNPEKFGDFATDANLTAFSRAIDSDFLFVINLCAYYIPKNIVAEITRILLMYIQQPEYTLNIRQLEEDLNQCPDDAYGSCKKILREHYKQVLSFIEYYENGKPNAMKYYHEYHCDTHKHHEQFMCSLTPEKTRFHMLPTGDMSEKKNAMYLDRVKRSIEETYSLCLLREDLHRLKKIREIEQVRKEKKQQPRELTGTPQQEAEQQLREMTEKINKIQKARQKTRQSILTSNPLFAPPNRNPSVRTTEHPPRTRQFTDPQYIVDTGDIMYKDTIQISNFEKLRALTTDANALSLPGTPKSDFMFVIDSCSYYIPKNIAAKITHMLLPYIQKPEYTLNIKQFEEDLDKCPDDVYGPCKKILWEYYKPVLLFIVHYENGKPNAMRYYPTCHRTAREQYMSALTEEETKFYMLPTGPADETKNKRYREHVEQAQEEARQLAHLENALATIRKERRHGSADTPNTAPGTTINASRTGRESSPVVG